MEERIRVLLFSDWYYPGFKAGGPIRSCQNLVATMGDYCDFYVLTSHSDLGESKAYPNIKTHQWNRGPNGEKIFYADPLRLNIATIRQMVQRINPDTVYFNSMFSIAFTAYPLIALKTMRQAPKKVLAPRGMLHAAALGMKSKKKKMFLRAFRLMQLNRTLHFHATDYQELKDIQKVFPSAPAFLAENIPAMLGKRGHLNKRPGLLRMISVCRVHPTKNIHFLLEVLKEYRYNGELLWEVYGDINENDYAADCIKLSKSLPSNIKVDFKGAIANEKVEYAMRDVHFFVLPTLGENFGHAIFEAMSCGAPPLLSDQTPWRKLRERQAGWDIPLIEKAAFAKAIEMMLMMDQTEYDHWSRNTRQLAEDYVNQTGFVEKYTELFK